MIFERAKFIYRKQKSNEPVEAFFTDLHCLSEYFEFGTLRQELIRGRIVVGLQNVKLSDRTLEKLYTQYTIGYQISLPSKPIESQ